MSFLNRRITNKDLDIVLSGSGVRAPCFIGGLEAVQEKGYHIHRIAGTSGGAIIAAAFALGYSTSEMRELSKNIPYADFKDFKIRNLLSLKNPGVYTGSALDNYYRDLYGKAKLRDFRLDCRISVVSIIGRKRQIITRETHPDLEVWKAVRMSSTIPFVFPYYELDGVPVTDGGLVTHMFDLFPDRPRLLVALRPRADHNLKRTIQDVKANTMFLWNYLKIIAEYFMDATDNQHVPQEEWTRTIVIPTFEIGSFNFNLDSKDVDKLIQYGYNAVILSDILP
jgi:NTE family protein